jgi:imidazolonepropionase-like amidohydrolase
MALLLKNGRVLTMADGASAHELDVLIEGPRIARVGPGMEPSGATVVDCSGKTLIPGLWDMHAHIISSEMFGLFLANGVTGVRNMWGNHRILEWADEVASGGRIGPSIHTTSPLMDGVEAWAGAVVVTTPEEAERAVLDAVGDGYRWLKTYPSIPRAGFIRLMELAREHGVKVVGHGNSDVTTYELVELGYHSIEHATMLPKSDDEVVRMADAGMWFAPTLIIVHRLWELAVRGDDVTQVPHYEYVNAREREDWDGITKALKTMPRMQQLDLEATIGRARLFAERSANVLLGTDQTNPGVVTGFSIHDELELLVSDLGFSPYRALEAGTVHAARHLGISDTAGTVETDKAADLVVLDGDPLENITNTRKIAAVVKAGCHHDRGALDRLLEEVLATPVEEIEFALVNELQPQG